MKVPPGEGFFYSNTNFLMLGKIAEAVTGKPPAKLLRERIFAPLGMTHTSYPPTGAPPGGSGEVPGFNSDFGYLPKLKAEIVVFVNTDIAAPDGDSPAKILLGALGQTGAPDNLPST